MTKVGCFICGYIYDSTIGDPDADIPEGMTFLNFPEDWICPDCGAGKDQFEFKCGSIDE